MSQVHVSMWFWQSFVRGAASPWAWFVAYLPTYATINRWAYDRQSRP
jgi:hypothetical protein